MRKIFEKIDRTAAAADRALCWTWGEMRKDPLLTVAALGSLAAANVIGKAAVNSVRSYIANQPSKQDVLHALFSSRMEKRGIAPEEIMPTEELIQPEQSPQEPEHE